VRSRRASNSQHAANCAACVAQPHQADTTTPGRQASRQASKQAAQAAWAGRQAGRQAGVEQRQRSGSGICTIKLTVTCRAAW
jgi:hypothetical protein